MRTLKQALERTPTALLREMARFWEIPENDQAGRPHLVANLLAEMPRPQAVQKALRRLDPEERDALQTVLAAGGRVQAPVLAETFGPLRPQRLIPQDPSALTATERLHRKGLLFRAFGAWDDWRGAVFFVPPELLTLLPHAPRETTETLIRPLDPQEVSLSGAADLSFHRDVACLLAWFSRKARSSPGNEGWGDDSLKRLRALLSPSHPSYAAFLLHTSQQARLFDADVEDILRPSAEGQQWLQAPTWLRVQVLFQAWRDHPTWDDLAAVPELFVERHWPADLALPRHRVLRHLSTCSQGDWLPLSPWIQLVREKDPHFLRPLGDPARPRIRMRETKAVLNGPASWDKVEGRYLRYLLSGPLHWMGLLDLGQAPGPSEAFRVTPLGQALLHEQARAPEMPEEAVMVEGTCEVWVPLEASPHIVFVLECCAERIQWDRVSRYRLTRSALHGALERGEQVDRLLEHLARHGRGEIPQNVAFSLQEWAAAYGRLRVERLLLLLAEDGVLLEEVLADPRVQEACGKRHSPHAVEVDPNQVPALIQALRRLGHTPQTHPDALPRRERISLSLTPGQAIDLLALLWALQEAPGSKAKAKAMAGLTDALTQALSPDDLAQARRRRAHWLEPR